MIVGNGLLAKSFQPYFENRDDILIFASGVSSSNEKDLSEFQREESLLMDSINKFPDKIFVYFSSCDVNNAEGRNYFSHKLHMENLIKASGNNYYIFRLPQVVGKIGNKNTIINFLFLKIKTSSRFDVWKYAYRNFIDIEDVSAIVNHMIYNGLEINTTINIASPIEYSILDVIKSIEILLDKKAIYTLVDKGASSKIDIRPISSVVSALNIKFDSDYLVRLLRKYYLNK